ncbi:aldehyde dehydrogenase family protein [Streptomyces sp. NPDC127068]|uniref:aldehyde dehydrogenase family protein n=1 Tax=Streptomyces sp. NPDC127068 TaxID=3347127 RepID=UPI00364DEA01
MSAQMRVHPFTSLGNFVGGKEIRGDRWIYALHPQALLDDAFASLTLKRRLESGRLSPVDVPEGTLVGRVALADGAVIEEATRAAAAAAQSWRAAPLSVRFDVCLRRLREAVDEHADELVGLLVSEGHPCELARWEVGGIRETLRPESVAFLRDQMYREFTIDGRRNIVRRQPDGVVCVAPPANAPLASALLGVLCVAGGNAVVVRAPRTAPYCVTYTLRHIIAPVLADVGAPPGVLNVVCAQPSPVLDAWIDSPLVDDIMFFGGVPQGLRVERRCVEAGKKPILELAGNDVVLVWKDADLDAAADALSESFHASGQLCMVPNQAVVHPHVADALIERIADRAQRLLPGYPHQEGVLLSPVLRPDAFHDVLNDALAKGAVVVTGGHAMGLDGARDDNGMFLQPTVVRVDGLARAHTVRAVREETFFPLLPVVVPEPDDDSALLDACLAFVNSNDYGLRNSLWTRDEGVTTRFLAHTSAGGLLKVNDSHIAFAAPLPTHGGTGLTGGVFGEANYPVLRTTHLQGVSIAGGHGTPLATRPSTVMAEEKENVRALPR